MKRICFLMEFRGDGYVHPVISEVMRDLERRGWHVDARITENEPLSIEDLRVEHDLYVLKSSSPMTDQVAALIAANGGRTLNDIAAVQRIRNKIWVDKFLRDRGIPIPESYLGRATDLQSVLEQRGALIIKPIGGRHGVGVRLVRDVRGLHEASHGDGVYAQEFKSGDGFDRKIYVAGGEVWASKKAFASGASYMANAQPVRLTPEMRSVALRIGQLLGLEIYGIDMIESEDGLWVVDVNGFPGFKGLSGVEPVLASYIDRRARG
ncbi:MAG TPA: ATP-grasp domain-containing protein [Thermoanaerobaculia bacterium]